MTILGYLVLLFLECLLMLFVIRGVNLMYIQSSLSKRQRQKIKYDTFFAWISYKKHCEVLPKIRIIWYYLNFVLFAISAGAIIACYLLNLVKICGLVIGAYFLINMVWLMGAKIGFY